MLFLGSAVNDFISGNYFCVLCKKVLGDCQDQFYLGTCPSQCPMLLTLFIYWLINVTSVR